MTGFINRWLYTYLITLTHWQYSILSHLHNLQHTVAVFFHHELPMAISCRELVHKLASYLTAVNILRVTLYSLSADNTENAVVLLVSADHTENISHSSYCCVATNCRTDVFTSAFHSKEQGEVGLLFLLLRALPSNEQQTLVLPRQFYCSMPFRVSVA
jgi:hypothetical protein